MESDPLFDHSTLEGRMQRVLKRFKNNWIWGLLPVLALLLVVTLLAANSDFDAALPSSTLNLKAGSLVMRPTDPPGALKYDNNLIGQIQSQKSSLKMLDVENVIIDAPLFSESLQDSAALTGIRLEHIGVSGNFSRVFLPGLKEFSLTQIRNAPTDTYKSPEALKSALFFDLEQNQTWDLEKDVLNLGVNIRVGIGGTTLLKVNRSEGLISLNLKNCEDIYRNLNSDGQPVTILSLSWCPVTDPALIPLQTLEYLNLNNAVPSEAMLAEILRGAPHLQEFHAFIPTDDSIFITLSPDEKKRKASMAKTTPDTTFISMTDFPASLITVSLSRVGISDHGPDYVSNIESLTLEMSDVSAILPNFTTYFPNLNKIAVINATSIEEGYDLLTQILKTSANWILMQDFGRDTNSTFNSSAIEAFLHEQGLPEAAEDFLIERNAQDGTFKVKAVTNFDKHFNRYNLLGFTDIETFDDYMYWDAVFRHGHKHLRAWANMPTGV